jgi:2-polyprenyl-6-methoxyphenol hydroxylase-like FAD-dependent oxidoreductase
LQVHDAVIVGARCAGSTLALALAKRGWDVVMVDRDTLPSETVSTHFVFPNTLARFERLGVLDTLRARHDLPLLGYRIVGLGHETAGLFTPIDGFDRAAGPRRSALDKALLDTALAAGARARLGERVVDLVGSGTDEDPVAGVVLASGERLRARWVFGADGRGSTVARRLGLQKQRRIAGEIAFLYAYWSGIPDDGYGTLAMGADAGVSRWAAEDGLHLLVAAGRAALTRGTSEERRRRYLETLRQFPETIEPQVLDRARLASAITVVPESLMRGFFRTAAGPGFALVGDSGHFKHPGTAQGIADAVEQALYVAEALSGPRPTLDGYERWRDERALEHYEWSFAWGRFPRAESEPLFKGWASDAAAGQELRDSFSRRVPPAQVLARHGAQKTGTRKTATTPNRASSGSPSFQ